MGRRQAAHEDACVGHPGIVPNNEGNSREAALQVIKALQFSLNSLMTNAKIDKAALNVPPADDVAPRWRDQQDDGVAGSGASQYYGSDRGQYS